MPKIIFHGVEYDRPEDMPPEIRSQYENAARSLPDRDANGIPDLLESEKPAQPVFPSVDPLQDLTGVPTVQLQKVASKTTRWLRIGVAAFILGVLGCIALTFFGIMSLMKSSEAYRLALDTARAHPTVQEMLGAPIQDGLFTTGSISENGTSGTADLAIPLSGSSQSGTLFVQADKEVNTWKIIRLILRVGDMEYSLIP
jgi:hypothetical protein